MLRIMFMIVIACHIPFIFFSGKEGVLIIIDELDRRSISKALEDKLAIVNGENKNGLEEDFDYNAMPTVGPDSVRDNSQLKMIKSQNDPGQNADQLEQKKVDIDHLMLLENRKDSQTQV